jgi:hypothetical protein
MMRRQPECAGDGNTSFLCCNWMHVYEVRPRKDKSRFDLISDVLTHGVC